MKTDGINLSDSGIQFCRIHPAGGSVLIGSQSGVKLVSLIDGGTLGSYNIQKSNLNFLNFVEKLRDPFSPSEVYLGTSDVKGGKITILDIRKNNQSGSWRGFGVPEIALRVSHQSFGLSGGTMLVADSKELHCFLPGQARPDLNFPLRSRYVLDSTVWSDTVVFALGNFSEVQTFRYPQEISKVVLTNRQMQAVLPKNDQADLMVCLGKIDPSGRYLTVLCSPLEKNETSIQSAVFVIDLLSESIAYQSCFDVQVNCLALNALGFLLLGFEDGSVLLRNFKTSHSKVWKLKHSQPVKHVGITHSGIAFSLDSSGKLYSYTPENTIRSVK